MIITSLGKSRPHWLAYSSGMIRVSENFKLGVVAATAGIMLVYLASMPWWLDTKKLDFLRGYHIELPFVSTRDEPVNDPSPSEIVNRRCTNYEADFSILW